PVVEWLTRFNDWVQEQGVWGVVCFGIIYVICTVLFVPGSILTLGAGAIYGPVWGTIVISLASTAGAACAFLLGRYVARDQVRAWMRSKPRFAALDQAIALKGGWIVFLLRLSPVFPFNLLNYTLGLTGVRFADYLVASLGMIPGTLLYVYYGKLAGDLATVAGGAGVEKGAGYWAVLILGLVATVGATMLVTRASRRALRQVEDG